MAELPSRIRIDGVSSGSDMIGAVIFLFILFWGQSGWYRVDCALRVQKACDLIAAEYDRKDKP